MVWPIHAQAPQRQAPVEVTIPKAPTPVLADGHWVLVYELHLTNLSALTTVGPRELTLHSVEVFPALASTRPIATLRDSALRASFRNVATMPEMSMSNGGMATPSAPRIAPGQRAVLFLWLPLATDRRAPELLRHRLTFSMSDSASGRPLDAISPLDSVVTPVFSGAQVPTIGPPMRGGDWLAGNGPSNSSDHRRTIVPLAGRARISQRFAIDFVKIGPNGNTWHDDRDKNENYWGYGEPVIAVADGEVVTAIDGISENRRGVLPPANLATVAGNHVILRIGPSQYAMFAHLQRGSVTVRAGQRVKRGDVLGKLGNSGQATAPHLHFQLMDAPAPLAAEGIPFLLDRFVFMGLGRDYDPARQHPTIAKQRELVTDDAVIRLFAPNQ
jgi:murein DD-endopeptidase MepM/ murein hydrolase activator NlpD